MASLVLRVDVRVYTCSKTRNGCWPWPEGVTLAPPKSTWEQPHPGRSRDLKTWVLEMKPGNCTKPGFFHQIFNAADGPEKSGFKACLTEIRPKPPSINPQNRKKSHNQNPGFARKTQVTHSPIPGLSRVSPRSRVFPGCLCCVLRSRRIKRDHNSQRTTGPRECRNCRGGRSVRWAAE